jgi:uncharacterized protein (DUF2062 family)
MANRFLGLVTTDGSRNRIHLDVLEPESIREFFRCRVLRPLLRLLRGGVTPRRLAWSLALGIVLGINPSVGLTTLLVVLLAWIFGLNQVASQIGVHVATPLHLLLFLPFIQLGVYLFHTRRLPLNRHEIEHLSHHPWRLFHAIWQWEWHALIVWGLIAAVAMPLLAIYIRRALVLLMRRHRTLLRSQPALHSSEQVASLALSVQSGITANKSQSPFKLITALSGYSSPYACLYPT